VRATYFVFLLPVFAACADTGDDDATCTGGKCDGVDQSCSDKRYGDGVCDTSLDCAVPDIDCFVTFDDDAKAATWWGEFEAVHAAQESRPARSAIATTDPRFAKAKALVEQGWAAFRVQRPVGKLGDLQPSLVVVDDPTVNAFVAPDLHSERAGFAIMVQTGLIDSAASDDSKLGVMMHELQHAIGLHVIGKVAQDIQRFYIADYDEPIGRFESDSAEARAAGTAWRESSSLVGGYSSSGLGGYPMLGSPLYMILSRVINEGVQANPTACANAQALLDQVTAGFKAGYDPISSAIDGDLTASIDQALTALRDECVPSYPKTFIQVAAEVFGQTPEQLQADLSPDELALVTDHHVVDAISGVTAYLRGQMRDVEAKFEKDHAPWSTLRYFSTEEDADDTSVLVLRGTKFQPAAIGDFFLSLLPGDKATQCEGMVDAREVPPYGVDLSDQHHGTCWRAYHVNAFEDYEMGQATSSPRLQPLPQGRVRKAFVPLSERIKY
jgi:Peptidase family M48